MGRVVGRARRRVAAAEHLLRVAVSRETSLRHRVGDWEVRGARGLSGRYERSGGREDSSLRPHGSLGSCRFTRILRTRGRGRAGSRSRNICVTRLIGTDPVAAPVPAEPLRSERNRALLWRCGHAGSRRPSVTTIRCSGMSQGQGDVSTAEGVPAPDRASSFARILDPRRHNEGGYARRGDGFFNPVAGDVSRETATWRWPRARKRRCSPLELGRDGPANRVGNSDLRPAVPTCRFARRDEVRTCLSVATVRGSSLCVGRVRSTSSSPSTSRTDRTHESREVVRCERQVRAGAHRSARPARTHARCCFSPARSGDWRPLKRPRSPCQTSRRNDRSRQGREGVRPSPSRSHRGSQQPRGHTCRWPTRRGDRAHEGATWDRCVHGPGGQHRGARGPACGPMSTTLDAGLRPMITLPTSCDQRAGDGGEMVRGEDRHRTYASP
jgi:hypothetical protein